MKTKELFFKTLNELEEKYPDGNIPEEGYKEALKNYTKKQMQEILIYFITKIGKE